MLTLHTKFFLINKRENWYCPHRWLWEYRVALISKDKSIGLHTWPQYPLRRAFSNSINSIPMLPYSEILRFSIYVFLYTCHFWKEFGCCIYDHFRFLDLFLCTSLSLSYLVLTFLFPPSLYLLHPLPCSQKYRSAINYNHEWLKDCMCFL